MPQQTEATGVGDARLAGRLPPAGSPGGNRGGGRTAGWRRCADPPGWAQPRCCAAGRRARRQGPPPFHARRPGRRRSRGWRDRPRLPRRGRRRRRRCGPAPAARHPSRALAVGSERSSTTASAASRAAPSMSPRLTAQFGAPHAQAGVFGVCCDGGVQLELRPASGSFARSARRALRSARQAEPGPRRFAAASKGRAAPTRPAATSCAARAVRDSRSAADCNLCMADPFWVADFTAVCRRVGRPRRAAEAGAR